MNLKDLNINKDWSLFLDRDGVINVKRDNDYVKNLDEFIFIDGAKNAVSKLSGIFKRIVIVTNQQGIGKGLMTESNLEEIHGYMMKEIENAGGKIDQAYFAPQLKQENSIFRKPNIGMGALAKRDFQEINFSKSVLIGDSESDIEFGINLGMVTVFLQNGRNETTKADFVFNDLKEVAEQL